jgi:hypothetical protein
LTAFFNPVLSLLQIQWKASGCNWGKLHIIYICHLFMCCQHHFWGKVTAFNSSLLNNNNTVYHTFHLSQEGLLTVHKLLQCKWRLRTSFKMLHANINQIINRPYAVAQIHYLLICLHN